MSIPGNKQRFAVLAQRQPQPGSGSARIALISSAVETRRLRAYNGAMEDVSPYKIMVLADPYRLNRYRWKIFEDGMTRDRSGYDFATAREAYADAEKFRDKLVITLQKKN